MAYLQTTQDEEQEGGIVGQPQLTANEQQSPQAMRPETIQLTTGSSSQIPAGGSGAPAQGQPQRTGGVTDFNRMLEANQPQAQSLAQNLGSQVQSNVTSSLAEAQENVVSRFGQNAAVQPIDQSLIQAVETDPTAVLANQNQAQQFSDLLSGQYFGPTEFSAQSQAELQQAMELAQTEGQRFQDAEGLNEILTAQSDTLSPGRTAFDLALLQGDQGAQAALQGFAEDISAMGAETQSAAQSAIDEIIAQNQDERTRQAAEVMNYFTGDQGVLPSFQESITQGARELTDREIQELQTIDMLLAQRADLSDEQLEDLGISAEQYDRIREEERLSPAAFLSEFEPGMEITPEEFATEEDLAYYNALQQLLQQDPQFLTQAGGIRDADFVDYDLQGALDALALYAQQDDQARRDRDQEVIDMIGQEFGIPPGTLTPENNFIPITTDDPLGGGFRVAPITPGGVPQLIPVGPQANLVSLR